MARLNVVFESPVYRFDASGSTARFGTIASYAWSFGDGTASTTSTPFITHNYPANRPPPKNLVSVIVTSSVGTSTTQVFTGQTMSRNGGPTAFSIGLGFC